MSEQEKAYFEHLAKIMLQTRGTRFTAAETEKRKELHAIVTISFLSIYLTGWSFATALYPNAFSVGDNKMLSIVSVIASISLLVISLFEYAAGRSLHAEKFLQNALQISPMLRELERQLASPTPNLARMTEIACAYEDLVARAGVNHTSSDFRLWSFEKRTAANGFERLVFPLIKPLRRFFPLVYSAIFQIALILMVLATTGWLAFRVIDQAKF